MLQAFARVENFGAEEVSVALKLFLDGRTDRRRPAEDRCRRGRRAWRSTWGPSTSGVLKLQAAVDPASADRRDALAVDDEAYAVVDPPRQANVLLVTPGNEPLEFALGTDSAKEIADVEGRSRPVSRYAAGRIRPVPAAGRTTW